ncbi:hypothetical protein CPC08DRAFT_823642, partial [Agrocybe pediades]
MSRRDSPINGYYAFLNCPELTDLVGNMSSLKTLIRMTEICADFRQIAYRTVRHRVSFYLGKFVDKERVPTLCTLLHLTRAGIAGGIVRCIASEREYLYREVYPSRMEIIIPFSSDAESRMRWTNFLVACGYTLAGTASFSNEEYPCCKISMTFVNSSTGQTVCLIQSLNRWAITPLFHLSHTSSAYFLTSTRLYALYPVTHERGANLWIGRREIDHIIRPFNFGLRTFRNTSQWTSRPCGEVCPSAWRLTRGLKDVAVLKWGGILGAFDRGSPGSDPGRSDRYSEMDMAWNKQLFGSIVLLLLDGCQVDKHVGYVGHKGFLLHTSWVESENEEEVVLFTSATDKLLVCSFIGEFTTDIDPDNILFVGRPNDEHTHMRLPISFKRPVHEKYGAHFDIALKNLNLLSASIRRDAHADEDPLYSDGIVTFHHPLLTSQVTVDEESRIRLNEDMEYYMAGQHRTFFSSVIDWSAYTINRLPLYNSSYDSISLSRWTDVLPGRLAEVTFTLSHDNQSPFIQSNIR